MTVSIDVPQPRADVFAFLDVMANHEQFTDHMLTDWRVSGPPTGIGSRAAREVKAGGRSEAASSIEVVEAEDGRMIKERNVAGKGRRVGTGTYVLSDLPDGGTHVEFTYAFEQRAGVRAAARPAHALDAAQGNERAMTRLAEQLAALPAAA